MNKSELIDLVAAKSGSASAIEGLATLLEDTPPDYAKYIEEKIKLTGFQGAKALARVSAISEIVRIMHEYGVEDRQEDAAAVFGVDRSRISRLKRLHWEHFKTDTLIDMLSHAGVHAKLTFNHEKEAETVNKILAAQKRKAAKKVEAKRNLSLQKERDRLNAMKFRGEG